MPSTKITAAALAGALVTIIVWIIGATTGVDIPPEVAAAAVVVVSFGLGYVVRETNPPAAPPSAPPGP